MKERDRVPYLILHCRIYGKTVEGQSWERGRWCSVAVLGGAWSWIFFISAIFPIRSEGEGPLIPCLLSFDWSLLGCNTKTPYRYTINPRTPPNTTDTTIFVVKPNPAASIFPPPFPPSLPSPFFSSFLLVIFFCEPKQTPEGRFYKPFEGTNTLLFY